MKWILGNSLARYGLIISAGVGLTLCLFPNIVHGLFRSDEFMPHATCYLRNPQMILLHVSSDLVIGISYVCISTTLGYLVWKASRDIPFHWMFLAFGLFIVTCGFTHFMEVWTVWKPVYWLAGYVKLICGIASAATALALFPLVPKVFALIKSVKLSEERRAKLEIANHDLEAFAYSVSHDLRAPLRAIQGLADACHEDFKTALEPGAKDYLERINAASQRMENLIHDMLRYSSVSRSEFELSPVSLGAAVADAKQELQVDIENSRAEIVIEEPLPDVIANRTLVTQVLANLLGNALKFVADGVRPRVQISAREKAGLVRVSVMDNGIGIAPEFKEKIFGVFERLHSTDKYPGTGIGLAIVQKAMIRMQGQVGIDSPSEGGSCFWIELPKAI
jgi:signal transduction histidine kinase